MSERDAIDKAFEAWIADRFGLEFEQRESEWRVQLAPFRAGAEWMRAEAVRLACDRARRYRESRRIDELGSMSACAELAHAIQSLSTAPGKGQP